jgi:hypothetical protein
VRKERVRAVECFSPSRTEPQAAILLHSVATDRLRGVEDNKVARPCNLPWPGAGVTGKKALLLLMCVLMQCGPL